MQIDLKALDQRIKEMQLLRRMLSNPEYASLVATVQEQQTGSGAPRKASSSERRGVRHDMLNFVPSNTESAHTAREIFAKMQTAKYKFISRDPLSTIQTALRELARKGLVERAGIREESGAVLWKRL